MTHDARPSAATAEIADLVRDLEQSVAGEVRFDAVSKVLYSTDASIYQIEPLGVVIPRTEADIHATVDACRRYGVPILPRGAGTALSGQSVGRAVVLDCSKYLNRILELNVEERWARIQPGVVLDELNAELRPHGLWFAPDVSPSNRATLGGMMGNNSSGARSIIYGKTADHVLEMRCLLASGDRLHARDLDAAALKDLAGATTREGEICRTVTALLDRHRDEIRARYPKILRRVGGYALDELLADRPFNLSRVLIGSEGTLATTLEAKINLVPRPKPNQLGLIVVHFPDMFQALDASVEILETHPTAVELEDKYILDLTRQSLEYARQMSFVQGDPGALLFVEYFGETQAELIGKLDGLERRLRAKRIGTAYTRAVTAEEQLRIWKVRKAGMALLLGMVGDGKPVAGIEDSAVAPAHLAEYIKRLDMIVRHHGTSAAYYGHASVGCLHVRPIINLKHAPEIEKLRAIAEAVSDLVLEFGGAMSAEHGDGLSRSCWNEKLFGSTLYQAFRDVKAVFDPQGIMNPGKIVDAPPMTANLRYGPRYKTQPVATHFAYRREGGFDRAIEMCNGAAVCKKKLEGTMCPSYMVTREEEHSTRGRANALRAALSGMLPADALTSRRMYKVLDLCLECKGCKAECPSNVDMAKLKYEFLAHYYAKHGTPLRARLFGDIERLNRLGCACAPVSTWVAQSAPARWLFHRLGIHKNRALPPFAPETFTRWWARRGTHARGSQGQVVLFNDTYMTYNYPEIGKAAVKVLEAAGFEVLLVDKKCCGRPMISKGLIQHAKQNAQYNVEKLTPYVERGIPIVGCEPSCMLTFRDEYPDLLDDPRAAQVAKGTFLIDEFLAGLKERGELRLAFRNGSGAYLLHGHCHQKALLGSRPSLEMLRAIPGASVEEVDSGCCGMAGSFGYEVEHYDLSLAIGARRLFPAVEAKGPDCAIVAAGISCRQQIAHGTGRRARHLIEVLADAL